MKIAVVGLGYVGLPLAVQSARSCVSVLGIASHEFHNLAGWLLLCTWFGMSSRRFLREATGVLGDPYHLAVGTRGHA